MTLSSCLECSDEGICNFTEDEMCPYIGDWESAKKWCDLYCSGK